MKLTKTPARVIEEKRVASFTRDQVYQILLEKIRETGEIDGYNLSRNWTTSSPDESDMFDGWEFEFTKNSDDFS